MRLLISASSKYLLTGWRRFVLCIALGSISATSLPPWFFFPGILGFSVFLFLLNTSCKPAQAVYKTWLFSFGYHLFGLQWVSLALTVDSERFAWLIPFALVGLPAVLALIPALTMALLPAISQSPLSRAFAWATLWTLAEYIRGHILTGFPWNLAAYIVSFSDSLIQSASIIGAYGLSLLVILFTTFPFLFLANKKPYRTRYSFVIPSLLCLLPIILWIGGNARLSMNDSIVDPNILIRIVQGNIAQRDKWRPDLRASHLKKYISLSKITSNAKDSNSAASVPNITIWPETAVPLLLSETPHIRQWITQFLKEDGFLITGAPSITNTAPPKLHNSVIVLTHQGKIQGQYHKAHLVPFGEYLPLKQWLPLSKIVRGFTDFSAGTGLKSLYIPYLGITSPLICYEVIFPGNVISNWSTLRPNLLLNLTNDAWFGESAGPFQHLEHARLRAVEEGLPLIRVANTGISGFFDAFGRKMGTIGLNKEAYMDRHLARPIHPTTFFGRFGNNGYLGITIFLLISLVINRFYRRHRT
ncbi:MAG: apolipoprotein N-acyltransferase [Rhodospirillaceae bacterium]|nr:apolipoprotein N-acyltransferase [Rhodospirillaceae bacterium]|tara:strand:- start:383 stop:1969 length:1587 start_codon:yes stop_codon:yes gene_type:complete